MKLDGRRLLAIGGGGLIGSHVVDALLETQAAEILVFDNFTRGSEANLAAAQRDPRVVIWPDRGDILQPDVLTRAMEGIAGVFHLAALWLVEALCRSVAA